MAQDDAGTFAASCGQSLTVFLGGAGMRGGYNEEFMQVFREADICRPVYGNYAGLWGIADNRGILDMLADAVSVPFGNQPSAQPVGRAHSEGRGVWDGFNMELESLLGLTDTRDRLDWEARNQTEYNYTLSGVGVAYPAPPQPDRFNLIGYSWGAAVAARVALFYAASGVEVDFLGLIGAPINASLLAAVRGSSYIKTVAVVDLTQHGDAIYAGMSDASLIYHVPRIAGQMLVSPAGTGHFYYSDSGTVEALTRKRRLVVDLMAQGLE